MNINTCYSIVILSAGKADCEEHDLADKDVILSYLNIRSMVFESESNKLNQPSNQSGDDRNVTSSIMNENARNQKDIMNLAHIIQNRCQEGVLLGAQIPIIAYLCVFHLLVFLFKFLDFNILY